MIGSSSSYLPGVPEVLVVEGHGDGVDDARPAVETLCCKDAVDLLLLLPQFRLLLLHARVPALLVALVVPDVEGVHQREPASRVLDGPLVLLLAKDAFLEAANVLRKGLYLLQFAGAGGGVRAGGNLEASAVEAVHAREDIELLAEERLEALLALVAGVDFDAAIFDHAQLVLELFCVGRVAVHEGLEPADFGGVALEGLADLVLEVLDLDVLVEVGQQVLDLDYFGLLGELDHLADPALLDEVVLGDLDPQLLALVLILRLVCVLLRQLLLVVLERQRHCLPVEVHLAVDDDLCLGHLVVAEESQAEVQVELQSALVHELYQFCVFFLGAGGVEEDEDVVEAAVSALQLLHAVAQQLDPVDPLVVGDVHESRHELDGLEVPD